MKCLCVCVGEEGKGCLFEAAVLNFPTKISSLCSSVQEKEHNVGYLLCSCVPLIIFKTSFESWCALVFHLMCINYSVTPKNEYEMHPVLQASARKPAHCLHCVVI